MGYTGCGGVLNRPMATRFQQDHDWVKVRSACHQLAVDAWQRINLLTGLTPLHPSADGWFAQMIVSRLPADVDIVEMKKRLYDEYRVEIPLIDWHGNKLIRLSVQGYNSKRDVDGLLEALKRLLV